MSYPYQKLWTDEEKQRLTELVSQGWTFSRIGEHLGRGKNAAIGQAHRLKLQCKNPPCIIRKKKPRLPKDIVMVAPTLKVELKSPPLVSAKIISGTEMPISVPQRRLEDIVLSIEELFDEIAPPPRTDGLLDLMDLRHDTCRFPFSDPSKSDFGFCGEPVKPGKPYCPRCCAIAYKPETKKKSGLWRAYR
jgi:GcrA cell cycle regulator